MTQTYRQSTGDFRAPDGTLIARGYSGTGDGLNNPAMQNVAGKGPIPVGRYLIGTPFDDRHTGPISMRLDPFADNEMFGRSAFLIHGDNASLDHSASHGCIVLPRPARIEIASEGDQLLTVIP